jgi:hypothetical protein
MITLPSYFTTLEKNLAPIIQTQKSIENFSFFFSFHFSFPSLPYQTRYMKTFFGKGTPKQYLRTKVSIPELVFKNCFPLSSKRVYTQVDNRQVYVADSNTWTTLV